MIYGLDQAVGASVPPGFAVPARASWVGGADPTVATPAWRVIQ